MSLKTVMTRDTHELKNIDPVQEPRWMFDYLHRSGSEFTNPIAEVGVEVVASSEEVEQPTEEVAEHTVETPSDDKEMSMEDLRALYTKVTGKNLSPRYKDDREWITSKLS